MGQLIWLGEVETWYDEHGAGDPLVLLHPGGADARAWSPQLDALAARFWVFTPERRAHGRTPDADGPLTYDVMTRDTIAFRAIADAELAVVPGTSHGLLHEKLDLCNAILLDFLLNEPVPTFAPVRRGQATAGQGGRDHRRRLAGRRS